MVKKFYIATPVSHLFENKKTCIHISNLSDFLEIRDLFEFIGIKSKNINYDVQKAILYHCELNILSKWGRDEKEILKKINYNFNIKEISLHLKSRYKNIKLINGCFVGDGVPYTKTEMKENIKKNIKIIKEIFGDIIILVENINHLLTDVYDIITEPNFINEVINENKIYLLFDIAHAKITCINKRYNFDDYVKKLPLKRCRQIHLSKCYIEDDFAKDSHNPLEKEDWNYFKNLIHYLPELKYVTIEYYKDSKVLIDMINELRKIQNSFPKLLVWDTHFFNIKIGFVNDDKEIVGEVINNARFENYKILYSLTENQKLFEKQGFKFIEERIEYELKFQQQSDTTKFKFEKAIEKDLIEIKDIVRKSFRGKTRFYKDLNFEIQKVDAMYYEWIEKLIKGNESCVLIIREKDKIAAFSGISIKNKIGKIELIAVNENFRGMGMGNKIMIETINYFKQKQVNKITVVTQGDNLIARNLYEKFGFKLINNKKWMHWCNKNE